MEDLITIIEDMEETPELTIEMIRNHIYENRQNHGDICSSKMIEFDTVGETLLSIQGVSEDAPLSNLLEEFNEDEEYNARMFQNYTRAINSLRDASSYNLYSIIKQAFNELDENSGIGMGTYLMLYNNLKKLQEEVKEDEFF